MKRILLTGGPGTGKTTVLQNLEKRAYTCLPEVSREIIIEAQKNRGIDQLFLTHPDEFNEKLLSGRVSQYINCKESKTDLVFLDRGLPDIIAYNNYIETTNSDAALKAVKDFVYDFIFVFPPWKNIYKKDNERYESFEESIRIYENLKKTYTNLGYEVLEVPIDTIEIRANYILNIVEYS